MFDPLEDLPVDIHLSILESIEDLPALGNALAASASARRTFDQYAGTIVAAVTATFPKELQQTLRGVAVSLCDPALELPLVEGELIYNRESTYDANTDYEDSLPPVDFDLPPTVLKQLLDLSKRIYLLSTLMIKTHISRFNALQPEHLVKSNFQFSSYPFRKYPPGRPYVTTKTGPASWVEEYRVRRALWRLQYFCLMTEPNTRVAQSPVNLPCSIIGKQQEFQRIWSHMTKWEIDEVLAVQDFLESSRISLRAPPSFIDHKIVIPQLLSSAVSTKTMPPPSRSAESDAHPHADMPLSFLHGPSGDWSNPTAMQREATSRAALAELPPRITFQPTPNKAEQATKDAKDQDFIVIKRSTEAYNFFHRYGLRHHTSPLQRSQWESFRRLGFGVWDQDRLITMELSRPGARQRLEMPVQDVMTIDDMAFTWRSVESQAPQGRLDSEILASAMASVTVAADVGRHPHEAIVNALAIHRRRNKTASPPIPSGGKPGILSDRAGGMKLSKIERMYGISTTEHDDSVVSSSDVNSLKSNTYRDPSPLPSPPIRDYKQPQMTKIERLYGVPPPIPDHDSSFDTEKPFGKGPRSIYSKNNSFTSAPVAEILPPVPPPSNTKPRSGHHNNAAPPMAANDTVRQKTGGLSGLRRQLMGKKTPANHAMPAMREQYRDMHGGAGIHAISTPHQQWNDEREYVEDDGDTTLAGSPTESVEL